jgi:hypothetical protein
MRRAVLAGVLALAVALVGRTGGASGVAGAATATRTPTPTRTPTASKSATPAPPPRSLPARYYGTVTWFGKPLAKAASFEALVGGKVCGVGTFKSGSYVVDVKADADLAGCGTPGVSVTFRIDGLLANEAVAFSTGTPINADLNGPRFKAIPLAPGDACNNVASTYPNKTDIASFREAIQPKEALTAIWRWNSKAGIWEADVPGVPAASTLKAIDFADALWVCVNAQALYFQPETS